MISITTVRIFSPGGDFLESLDFKSKDDAISFAAKKRTRGFQTLVTTERLTL
jgi:hypothetical protein